MTKVQLKKRDREYEDVLGGMLRAWSLLGMKFSRPKHLEKGKKKEKVKKGTSAPRKKEEKTSPPGYFFIGTVKDFLKGTVLERKVWKRKILERERDKKRSKKTTSLAKKHILGSKIASFVSEKR